MKALLIHNPKAGGGKLPRGEAVELIERAGWAVKALSRDKADEEAIARAKPDLIVVAGGDGTVAKVACRLPDRSVPLALLPTGTANNIGRSLGLRTDLECAAAIWDLDRRHRLDLGRVRCNGSDRVFVEAVGFGAFARSLCKAPHRSGTAKKNGMAKIESGRAALRKALRDAPTLAFEISVDGKGRRLQALLLEVMNVPITGPWLRLCPEADPGDGQLDLAYLPPGAREKMRKWLDAVSESPPPLKWLRGSRIEVETGSCALRIDDELYELEERTSVSITLESEPLQVLASAMQRALDAPERSRS